MLLTQPIQRMLQLLQDISQMNLEGNDRSHRRLWLKEDVKMHVALVKVHNLAQPSHLIPAPRTFDNHQELTP